MGRIDSAKDEWPSPLASGWRGGWGGVEGVAVLMYLRPWAIMPALSQKGRSNSVNLKSCMQCLVLTLIGSCYSEQATAQSIRLTT